MNYSNLIQNITDHIQDNTTQAITGQVLQDVLVDMVGELGQSGALVAGIIDTSFVPDPTNDAQVYYIAEGPGNYTNFSLSVSPGEVAFFYFDGNAWAKSSVNVVEIVDSLNSTATDKALSANMGKALYDAFVQLGQDILNDELPKKADKVLGAVAGNFATLDANGNLKDSGIAPADKANKTYVDTELAKKADKVSGATNDNFATLDAAGNLKDSGVSKTDFSNLQSSLAEWLKSMGHYSAATTLNLTPAVSGKAVKTDGTVQNKTDFSISAPVPFQKGYRYLIKCAQAVGADVALFAQELSRRRDVAISYSYTYDSDGDIATATATYGGVTYTYTYTYQVIDGVKTLVSITDQDGNVVAALPLTYAENYTEYKPLFYSGASLPDSGYYVYTSMVSGNIVVSCKTTEMTQVVGVLDDVIAALCYGVADAMEVGSPETRALTEAITLNSKRLEADTDGLDSLGDAKAESMDTLIFPKVCGAPMILYGAGTPAANLVPTNWDSSTMGEWTGIPCFIGQLYVNINASANGLYVAKNTTGVNGWITA